MCILCSNEARAQERHQESSQEHSELAYQTTSVLPCGCTTDYLNGRPLKILVCGRIEHMIGFAVKASCEKPAA